MSLPCGSLSEQHRGTRSPFDQTTGKCELGFRSFDGALRTLQGFEARHMIRKGQVRWLAENDILAQVRFIEFIFQLAAWLKSIEADKVLRVFGLFATDPIQSQRSSGVAERSSVDSPQHGHRPG